MSRGGTIIAGTKIDLNPKQGAFNVKKHSNEEPRSCGGYGPFCSSCSDSTTDAEAAAGVYDPFYLFLHWKPCVNARRPRPNTRRSRNDTKHPNLRRHDHWQG